MSIEDVRRAKNDAQRAIERAKLHISPRATEGQTELVKRIRTKFKGVRMLTGRKRKKK